MDGWFLKNHIINYFFLVWLQSSNFYLNKPHASTVLIAGSDWLLLKATISLMGLSLPPPSPFWWDCDTKGPASVVINRVRDCLIDPPVFCFQPSVVQSGQCIQQRFRKQMLEFTDFDFSYIHSAHKSRFVSKNQLLLCHSFSCPFYIFFYIRLLSWVKLPEGKRIFLKQST